MAYIDKDDPYPIWLGEPLPEDLLSGMSLEALVRLVAAVEPEILEDESCGFIVKGWFGPFLLGPVSRSLRGRC